MRRSRKRRSGVGEISENEEINNESNHNQGRLRIDANFKRFVDEEVLPEQGWTLRRSGAILMKSFTICTRKSSVAGRTRSHSGGA